MNAATTPRSAAALRGDESALYRELQPRLLGLVRTRVHAPDQTLEDACSFAWVALIEHQPARGEALLGWLYVVACREAWRLLARAARIPALDPAAVARLAGSDERAAQLRATAIEALEALAALPERQRRLLAGKAAGYGYRELAALEGSSFTAVNRHLTRARNRIREARGGELRRASA